MWPEEDGAAWKTTEVRKMCCRGGCTGVYPEKWHVWGRHVSVQAFLCAPAFFPQWEDLSGRPGCRLRQGISLNLSHRVPASACLRRACPACLPLTLMLLLIAGFLIVDSNPSQETVLRSSKACCAGTTHQAAPKETLSDPLARNRQMNPWSTKAHIQESQTTHPLKLLSFLHLWQCVSTTKSSKWNPWFFCLC